jgi:hypothetical protein
MPVAKSFQSFEKINEPYESAGRMYVDVRNPKTGNVRKVRWYDDYEYYRMYPEEKKAENTIKATRPLKDVLGFEKGYITIFKGETYPHLEWFQQSICRYHKMFGWYVISTEEVPADLPLGVSAVRLLWEDVRLDEENLKPEEQVRSAIDKLIFEPSPSEYVGAIGDRIEIEVTIKNTRSIDSYYGSSIIHTMEDADGNVYVWITAAKNWPVGAVKKIRGTIKDHKEYKGTKQTYLTRCAEVA